MAGNNQLNPRQYQELIDRIKNGQPIEDLLSKYDPMAIQDILENSTAEFTKNKHPFDLFEKPELFSKVKTKIEPNMKGLLGETRYVQDTKTGFQVPDKGITIALKDAGDKGTLLHESQHAYDFLSRPQTLQPVELEGPSLLSNIKEKLELNREIKSPKDLKGIEEATEFYSKHFKPDVDSRFGKLKQMLNIESVVKGNPLKMIAPIAKAAGIGALGYSAIGIGNKALAGDFGEAGMEAADLATDLTPVVGEVKMAVSPTKLGNAELPQEEMEKREKFNRTKQLLNK